MVRRALAGPAGAEIHEFRRFRQNFAAASDGYFGAGTAARLPTAASAKRTFSTL